MMEVKCKASVKLLLGLAILYSCPAVASPDNVSVEERKQISGAIEQMVENKLYSFIERIRPGFRKMKCHDKGNLEFFKDTGHIVAYQVTKECGLSTEKPEYSIRIKGWVKNGESKLKEISFVDLKYP